MSQALPIGQLGESYAQELVQATEAPDVEISLIFGHHTPKRMPRSEFQKLREHQLASLYPPLPAGSGKAAGSGGWRSNR
jgi:hypothetical protein